MLVSWKRHQCYHDHLRYRDAEVEWIRAVGTTRSKECIVSSWYRSSSCYTDGRWHALGWMVHSPFAGSCYAEYRVIWFLSDIWRTDGLMTRRKWNPKWDGALNHSPLYSGRRKVVICSQSGRRMSMEMWWRCGLKLCANQVMKFFQNFRYLTELSRHIVEFGFRVSLWDLDALLLAFLPAFEFHTCLIRLTKGAKITVAF